MSAAMFGAVPAAAASAAPAAAASVPAAKTVATQGISATLVPGTRMVGGTQRATSTGQIVLTMQNDGDLVLTAQGQQLWHTNTSGYDGATLNMQTDGNLVLRAAGGQVLWHTDTWSHPGARMVVGADGRLSVRLATSSLWATANSNSTLTGGHVLQAGWTLVSGDGHIVTSMQSNGHLAVRRDGHLLWASPTGGNFGAYASMQTDGNLVIRASDGRTLWHTFTWKYPGASVTTQNDGYLVVYSTVNAPIWWKDIGRGATLCRSTQPDPRGDQISQWNPVTLCVLAVLRQSSANVSDVNIMIRYESGGDANAVNNWDINAQNGHPSMGLIQVIKPTFDRYRSQELPDDQLNPAANLYAGLNYAINRYGSIHDIPGLVSLRNGGGYKGYSIHN